MEEDGWKGTPMYSCLLEDDDDEGKLLSDTEFLRVLGYHEDILLIESGKRVATFDCQL